MVLMNKSTERYISVREPEGWLWVEGISHFLSMFHKPNLRHSTLVVLVNGVHEIGRKLCAVMFDILKQDYIACVKQW